MLNNFTVNMLKPGTANAPVQLLAFGAMYMGTSFGFAGGDAPSGEWGIFNSLEEYKEVHGWSNNVRATATVKFTLTAPATAGDTIPAGTVVETADDVEFTTDTLWTATGAETEVDLAVSAVKGGSASSDIPVGDINVLPTAVTNVASVANTTPSSGGADIPEPDLDYTGEQIAYLHFGPTLDAGVGPIAFMNAYNSTAHAAGVSAVVAADFTALLPKVDDLFPEKIFIPLWFAIPGFGHDSSLFAGMLEKRTYNSVFNLSLVIDYDPTETVLANVETALGVGSAYRFENVGIGWTPDGSTFNGYFASIWRILLTMLATANPEQGNNLPYWSSSNETTGLPYLDTETPLTMTEARRLTDVGCFTFERGAHTDGNVRLIGSNQALYLDTTVDNSGEYYVYSSDETTNQFNWNWNQIVIQLWNDVSRPLNFAGIQSVIAEVNNVGVNQVSQGAMLGYQVLFTRANNPVEQLAQREVTLEIEMLPAPAMNKITVKQTINFAMFDRVFGA